MSGPSKRPKQVHLSRVVPHGYTYCGRLIKEPAFRTLQVYLVTCQQCLRKQGKR